MEDCQNLRKFRSLPRMASVWPAYGVCTACVWHLSRQGVGRGWGSIGATSSGLRCFTSAGYLVHVHFIESQIVGVPMRRFLPPEAEVTLYETGFDADILNRAEVGKSLSALIDSIQDPLVIAVDGRWGTGKSYFLKRWVGAHRLQNAGKALTLYFDAFADDYFSDPLIALVAALSERVPEENKPKIARLKTASMKFIKPLMKIGLNIVTFGAKEALNDLGDAAADAFNAEAQSAVDQLWQHEAGRQKGMVAFRDALSDLLAGEEGADPTPLVIVVDELDRCRPDYALEVLEVIKHFFNVPMVHFVLGVNLLALENSVKARYGQGIDAKAYLQKFISLTLTLPDHVGPEHDRVPAVLAYAKKTAKEMQLQEAYIDELVNVQLPVVARRNPTSIRDIGKILGAIAVLPPEALRPDLLPGWLTVAVSLIIARVIRKDIFDGMVAANLSDKQLEEYFDATSSKITEWLDDGTYNQDYDHQTWWMYRTWQFVLAGKNQLDTEGAIAIAQQFGRSRSPEGIRNIPKKVYDDWLNTFKFS